MTQKRPFYEVYLDARKLRKDGLEMKIRFPYFLRWIPNIVIWLADYVIKHSKRAMDNGEL